MQYERMLCRIEHDARLADFRKPDIFRMPGFRPDITDWP